MCACTYPPTGQTQSLGSTPSPAETNTDVTDGPSWGRRTRETERQREKREQEPRRWRSLAGSPREAPRKTRKKTAEKEKRQKQEGGRLHVIPPRLTSLYHPPPPPPPPPLPHPGSVVLQVAAFVLNGVGVTQLFQKLDLFNDVLPLLQRATERERGRERVYETDREL